MGDILHIEALNLRHLRAWVTVVDEGSITGAARKLGVSQPALSQQLKALENFFGQELVERLSRGVKPTPFGRTVLSEALSTLATSERLLRQAGNAGGAFGGTLEVAALPTLVDGLLLEPIQKWLARFPSVSIRIREFSVQTDMVAAFGNGLADLAIGVRPPNWSGECISLGWDEFVVLLPEHHPRFRQEKPIDLSDLAEDQWILYGKSHGLSQYMDAACAIAGFSPKEAVRTSQAAVAMKLACAGLGTALVPRLNVLDTPEKHVKNLTSQFAWEIVAFSRSGFSESANQFVALIDSRNLGPKPDRPVTLVN